MEGVFIQRNKTNLWIIILLCGAVFIARYFYLRVAEPAADKSLIYLVIGILLCAVVTPFMLFNRGSYIRIDESTVKARYHFFGKLDCNIKDIEFVLPQVNTLSILLKNGKRHVIVGVINSWELSNHLRLQCFEIERELPDTIRQKLSLAQTARWREIRLALIGIVLMFAAITASVLLTGGRDTYDFTKTDHVVSAVMYCVGSISLIGTFLVAERAGKLLLPIEQLNYRLRGAVIVSSPLPTNNAIAAYTDWDHSGRVVLCGFPNDESVYYCLQKFTENFELETTYTSKIYSSRDKLPSEEQLIDITASVLADT